MNSKDRQVNKRLSDFGVERISHRRNISSKTILEDLKQLATRLGRKWSPKTRQDE